MPTGRAAPPDTLHGTHGAVASRPRSRSRLRTLDDFAEMGKEARSRLPPDSRAQPRRAHPRRAHPRRAHPIRLPRRAVSGDGPYRGDEQQGSAPQLVGHPLHERADSEGSRRPRQDGQRVSAMKEVAVSLTIGASGGLALAWGYGLPGAL